MERWAVIEHCSGTLFKTLHGNALKYCTAHHKHSTDDTILLLIHPILYHPAQGPAQPTFAEEPMKGLLVGTPR